MEYGFPSGASAPSQHLQGDVSAQSFCSAVVGLAGVSGRQAKIKIIQRFKIKLGINALLSTKIEFC